MPDHNVQWLADGVPAFRLVNTCRDGRYRIEKQIVTDPHRDTVLQQIQFVTRSRARCRIITCMSCLRRIWEIKAAATLRGWANSRGRPCCSRSETTAHWRWRVPRRGPSGRPATSVLRMAGRT